ncbi:ATP-binding cassette domain-containing protein [Spiroplasma eriocheiris]|uniref:ATP-binding cassette domain-containing protein n=2 Tax=Spiroplasma eriocheiris TaxID=315358 RepID=UPI002E814B9E|nr:ATP-binding cassette domain-containing protein [Spiroplasma eriocheiris]
MTNGVYGQALKNGIRTLMMSLGLWEHRNKDVNSFSSGMKKRIMIIQGIIHNPDILILDEPEAGLDIANRKKVIKYLKFLTLKGKTVFFSSHLLDEIKDYIDEYTLVINGRQIQTGTLDHLEINNTYYIVVDNNEKFVQFFTANNVKNWYDKDTKRINFVIQNPLHLQFVTKFAEENKIKIFKIGQTEFSFDFLLKKDNLIKLEQQQLAIKQNSKDESD